MKAISGLTSIFDSLTKVVISLLALGIVLSLLGGNVPFVVWNSFQHYWFSSVFR